MFLVGCAKNYRTQLPWWVVLKIIAHSYLAHHNHCIENHTVTIVKSMPKRVPKVFIIWAIRF